MSGRGRKSGLVLLTIIMGLVLLNLAPMGFAQSTAAKANVSMMVSHCVDVVHKTSPSPAVIDTYGPVITSFYKNFDAFYNPALEVVQNNAETIGSQPALFVFQKCMMENGFPLK